MRLCAENFMCKISEPMRGCNPAKALDTTNLLRRFAMPTGNVLQIVPITKPNTVYIYALLDPGTEEVRYVGKTVAPKWRYRSHLHSRNNRAKRKWILWLHERGLEPDMRILEECSFADADKRERVWIAEYLFRGFELFNVTHNTGHRPTWSELSEIPWVEGPRFPFGSNCYDDGVPERQPTEYEKKYGGFRTSEEICEDIKNDNLLRRESCI